MRSTEGYTEWEAGPSKAGAMTAASTSTARTNSNNLYNRLHSAVAERVQPHFSLHYVSLAALLTMSSFFIATYRAFLL